MGPSFHARTRRAADATCTSWARRPEPLAGCAWALPDSRAFPDLGDARLDVDAMTAALAHAVGSHDFTGFARPGEQRGAVRTVTRAEVVSASWAPLHALVFEGQGFSGR